MFADIFPLQAVNIINPTTLSVTKTLTTDPTGQPLTNAGADGATANSSITWNDAVYVDVRPALLCVVLCCVVLCCVVLCCVVLCCVVLCCVWRC